MEHIEVRDLRGEDWVWSAKKFLFHPNVDSQMYKVYSGLAAYANNISQKAFPGIQTLAEKLHMGRSTVIRAITKLEKYKFIKVERSRGSHNIYSLLKIPDSSPPRRLVEPVDETVFNWDDYKAGMLNDPRKEINIIAYFFNAKQKTFETKAQVEVAIRTHLNDAKDLAKFDRKKVGEKIRKLAYDWPKSTLKTVTKELVK